jgi:hypothetical protein
MLHQETARRITRTWIGDSSRNCLSGYSVVLEELE